MAILGVPLHPDSLQLVVVDVVAGQYFGGLPEVGEFDFGEGLDREYVRAMRAELDVPDLGVFGVGVLGDCFGGVSR